ncbi:MAG TPA: rubredoxin [Clostridiales bacterium]|nr:rubredoxin [Clostridiales bacterium]
MRKFICSICGYIYDEVKGIPESGIAAGTRWEEIPSDWLCPLCGASKAEFTIQGETVTNETKKHIISTEPITDMIELSPLEVSAICSNLARGCEKQYKPEEEKLFRELAQYYSNGAVPAENPRYKDLLDLIDNDLNEGFPSANAVAQDLKDRGALRALVWSEKVTRILKSLLSRYEKEGDGMVENTGVYVCTICGFIFIGDNPPDLCPVCKVPNWKFEKIEGES